MYIALRALYDDSLMTVTVQSFTADDCYPILNDLLEGPPLSPLLYIIFMHSLIGGLHKLGLGMNIIEIWLSALMFADDLTLLALSPVDLQKMLAFVHTTPQITAKP